MPERPYTYYDFTLSLCPHCLRRIEAKIVFEDGGVYMLKRCPEHGRQRVRIATDVEYYKSHSQLREAQRNAAPLQHGHPLRLAPTTAASAPTTSSTPASP